MLNSKAESALSSTNAKLRAIDQKIDALREKQARIRDTLRLRMQAIRETLRARKEQIASRIEELQAESKSVDIQLAELNEHI